ncbi:RNA-directed DNA polymerase, eukaryota, reverse transcriptase zinc-binding domain protein [Tanacetum coccineum]
MGSYRSKEDDVSRISTSIYIMNFPESFSAKELFQSCKQYGHVVDTLIPSKRSKAGKRFGFVRFINVFNEERLVNNLCTIWVGRFKFHANIARFQRAPMNDKNSHVKKDAGINRSRSNVSKKDEGVNVAGKSYVHVVKGNSQSGTMESDSAPAIVLDDDCLHSKDLSNSVFGRVKEFAALSNLKTALTNEGFANFKIQYMGELWVLLEFDSANSKRLFHDNIGIGSWFSQLKEASLNFNTDGRIVWVEIEGVPFKLWSGNTFKRIVAKWGELLDVDDEEDMYFHLKRLCIYTRFGMNILENFKIIFWGKVFWIRAKEVSGWVPDFLEESDDDESDNESKGGDPKAQDLGSCGDDSDVAEVPETVFERERQSNDKLDEESIGQMVNHSEDPFGIYTLLNKKKVMNRVKGTSDQSLKYPPGFTPNEIMNEFCTNAENVSNVNCDNSQDFNVEETNVGQEGNSARQGSKEDVSESACSGHFKKSVAPRTGGSILCLMEELVKVGQTMGYNMDGCLSNMTEIIESQGAAEVYR